MHLISKKASYCLLMDVPVRIVIDIGPSKNISYEAVPLVVSDVLTSVSSDTFVA